MFETGMVMKTGVIQDLTSIKKIFFFNSTLV